MSTQSNLPLQSSFLGSPEHLALMEAMVADLNKQLNAYTPTDEELARESRTAQSTVTFVPAPRQTSKRRG